MKRIIFLVFAAVSLLSCTEGDRYCTLSGYAQGGTYSLKINMKGVRLRPSVIQAAVDSILFDVDTTLSGYNKASMLSRFNSGGEIVPNRIFTDIYSKAFNFYEASGGAFDAAAGPLFDMWGFGFKNDSLPDARTVEETVSSCGMKMLKRDIVQAAGPDGVLSPRELLVGGEGRLPVLNFNAIAQGYSADLVASYLMDAGVSDMLVDIGEIFCRGLNPKREPWTIGVDRPVDGNFSPGADLKGIHRCSAAPQGVVTSGNYRKFYVRDGRKYAHTIDPRTGYPVTHNLLSATVIAHDSATADALATWCMVVGFDESKHLLESGGYDAYLIYDNCGKLESWHTDGFDIEEL